MTKEIVEDVEEYLPHFFEHSLKTWQNTPQLRTIPVGVSIPSRLETMPYENAEEIIRGHTSFAVSNCICRQGQKISGKGCGYPEENCLTFGRFADHAVSTGRGRAISKEDTLAILKQAEEVGLVLQPGNARACR